MSKTLSPGARFRKALKENHPLQKLIILQRPNNPNKKDPLMNRLTLFILMTKEKPIAASRIF